MTPAVSTSTSCRPHGGGRVQGVLAIATLIVSVLATVVLVATPASSAGSSRSGAPTATGGRGLALGLRVEVQGGRPTAAYALADRLASVGVRVEAVEPASSAAEIAPSTVLVYYDRRSMPAAERLRSMLGSGTLQRRQVFQPEVDVTIVLGKDVPRL